MRLLIALALLASFAEAEEISLPIPVTIGNGEIEKKYDKFRDEDVVSATSIRIKIDGPMLASKVLYRAKPGQVPNPIWINIEAHARNWVNLKVLDRKQNIHVIIDGRKADWDMEMDTNVVSDGVVETYLFEFTPKQFAELAHAKKIELQIGVLEFELWDSAERSIQVISSTIPRGSFTGMTIVNDPELPVKVDPPKSAATLEFERQQAEKKAEESAESSLKLARTLAEQGKKGAAKTYLQMIIDKYPNTKAAKESAELLQK